MTREEILTSTDIHAVWAGMHETAERIQDKELWMHLHDLTYPKQRQELIDFFGEDCVDEPGLHFHPNKRIAD